MYPFLVFDQGMSSRYVTGVNPLRHIAALLLLLLVAIATACPQKDEGVEFRLRAVFPACPDPTKSSAFLNQSTYTLRITFLHRKLDASGAELDVSAATIRDYSLACYLTVPKGQTVEFKIPPTPSQAHSRRYTVVVEAFSQQKLIFVGRAEDTEIGTSGTIDVYLRPTTAATSLDYPKGTAVPDGFSCLAKLPKHYRAFHTATLLPDGQVLLVGGLAASADSALSGLDKTSQVAYATGTVDVYDPKTLEFRTLAQQVSPRAFHHAVLLPSNPRGPYRVLLVGGITPDKAGSPVARLALSQTLPFLVTPHESAKPARAEIVTYDPAASKLSEPRTLDGLPGAMFPAAAEPTDALAIAGGGQSFTPRKSATEPGAFTREALNFHRIGLKSGEDPSELLPALALDNTRVGHAMARLGPDTYLVVGGNMDGELNDHGESVSMGAGAPTPLQFTSDPTDQKMTSIWHTLTPIGISDADLVDDQATAHVGALWVGGFNLANDSPTLRYAATTPRPQEEAVVLVRSGTPGAPEQITTTLGTGGVAPGHFRSAGYHAGIRLADGSVLLSGGNIPDVVSNFRASGQVVVYTYDKTASQVSLAPLGRQLKTPRFGHRMTRLLDNTILITGGVTLVETTENGKDIRSEQLVKEAEIFSPHLGSAVEDYPLSRPPPLDTEQQAQGAELCPARYPEGGGS